MQAAATPFYFSNTPDSYWTGSLALNLPAPEGTSGDWHKVGRIRPGDETRLRRWCAGSELFSDTRNLMELDGVYDCTDTLRKQGFVTDGPIYAANHFRALIDLVVTWYDRGSVPAPVPFADFLPHPEHQRMFFRFLNRRARLFPKALRSAFAAWLVEDRRIERLKWYSDAG